MFSYVTGIGDSLTSESVSIIVIVFVASKNSKSYPLLFTFTGYGTNAMFLEVFISTDSRKCVFQMTKRRGNLSTKERYGKHCRNKKYI